MTTTIQYKTLTLARKNVRDQKTFSKAETVYNPILFDEHVINLASPSVTLKDIEQTIFEEKSICALEQKNNPVYSFVWFLN
ncbi:MAG: hypothetical protein ACTHJT_00785 [Cytophaga sp.]|uniref:hypothetical protein n=1 Tax=Cytophaga sp. TaxID=29535 RepID=UPI003F7EC456